jgi:hypothetical protein
VRGGAPHGAQQRGWPVHLADYLGAANVFYNTGEAIGFNRYYDQSATGRSLSQSANCDRRVEIRHLGIDQDDVGLYPFDHS